MLAILMEQMNRRNNADLMRFIPMISKKYSSPAHLKPLIDWLNLIINGGQNIRLLISIPPRHGKTESIVRHSFLLA